MRRHWVRRETHGVLWGGGLLLLSAAACGGDDGSSLACGEGTTQKGDVCVPVDAGTPYMGTPDSGTTPETKPDSGSTPETGGTTAAASCGAGTVLVDGKCVVDPASQLVCGDGTLPVNGKCEVAPPPPLALNNLVVSQLSLKNRGQLVSDGGDLRQFYPVEVSVGLTYKGDAAKIPVVFALGEPPDPTKTPDQQKDLGFCLVGGFFVDHPGGSSETEKIASATLRGIRAARRDVGVDVVLLGKHHHAADGVMVRHVQGGVRIDHHDRTDSQGALVRGQAALGDLQGGGRDLLGRRAAARVLHEEAADQAEAQVLLLLGCLGRIGRLAEREHHRDLGGVALVRQADRDFDRIELPQVPTIRHQLSAILHRQL